MRSLILCISRQGFFCSLRDTIFRWPGLGKLAMDAITNRDYPVIQGFVLFTSTVYVVINLLIDICYSWVDPRLRKNGGRS